MSDEVMRRMSIELDNRQGIIHELRAKVEALEKQNAALCFTNERYHEEIEAVTQERDRLKEALSMAEVFLLQNRGIGLLWNGPQELALCTMQAALRGETGGA